MTASLHLTGLSALVLCFAVACPPVVDDDLDDDDSAPADDDDSAVGDDDDDDDTGPVCAAAEPPYTMQFTGEFAGSYLFDTLSCTDYNGDVWNLNYATTDGWTLRLVVGPLVQGETLTQGLDISLLNNGLQSGTFQGRTANGHVASVTPEVYQPPASPCGTWTSDPLVLSTGATTIDLGPQPIPFHCP